MKAWNYINNDFDQEMGQQYSTIVQKRKSDFVTLVKL